MGVLSVENLQLGKEKLPTYIVKLKTIQDALVWIICYHVLQERGTYVMFSWMCIKYIWEGRQAARKYHLPPRKRSGVGRSERDLSLGTLRYILNFERCGCIIYSTPNLRCRGLQDAAFFHLQLEQKASIYL